jgi:hypothetical protein
MVVAPNIDVVRTGVLDLQQNWVADQVESRQ